MMKLQTADEAGVIRGRRQAIYALVAFCAVFFIGGIIVSYVVAAHYGYGFGFGDGFVKQPPVPRGSGFFVDIAILTANAALDSAILFAWYWLMSRLEAVCGDDPLSPDDGADLRCEESWYYIQIPALTRVLVAIAGFCLVGVSLAAASMLPVVLIRYGW
jgi:hypothetical protein